VSLEVGYNWNRAVHANRYMETVKKKCARIGCAGQAPFVNEKKISTTNTHRKTTLPTLIHEQIRDIVSY
jgi:hypothetical protein